MKIEANYFEMSSRARVIVAVSLTLFLLFLVWLASLMVIASLSVARGSQHEMLFVGIASLQTPTFVVWEATEQRC